VKNLSKSQRKINGRKIFGGKVRAIRLSLRLTQEKLAERAELHPTYIGSVERGERNISLDNIISLAHGLQCSPKDLMPE